MTIENKIQRLVDRLAENLHPQQIILFGSQAWGKPRQDSDVDLFVVQDSAQPRRQRQLNARRILAHEDVAVDVFVYTPAELQANLEQGNAFMREVIEKGRVLYGEKISS